MARPKGRSLRVLARRSRNITGCEPRRIRRIPLLRGERESNVSRERLWPSPSSQSSSRTRISPFSRGYLQARRALPCLSRSRSPNHLPRSCCGWRRRPARAPSSRGGYSRSFPRNGIAVSFGTTWPLPLLGASRSSLRRSAERRGGGLRSVFWGRIERKTTAPPKGSDGRSEVLAEPALRAAAGRSSGGETTRARRDREARSRDRRHEPEPKDAARDAR